MLHFGAMRRSWICSLILITVGCGQPQVESAPPTTSAPSGPAVSYHVYRDESFDQAANSAVRMYCVLDSPLSVANVGAALHALYDSIKGRSFRYHPDDFGISVFLYSDEARAKAAGMIWVGRIDRSGGSTDAPKFDIREEAINIINEPQKTMFNMTEAQRKAMIYDESACEDRLPLSDNSGSLGCQRIQMKAHHLTQDQFQKVEDEAMRKLWPTK